MQQALNEVTMFLTVNVLSHSEPNQARNNGTHLKSCVRVFTSS